MSALTRLRSLSLSSNHLPPVPLLSARALTEAKTIERVNSEFHSMIHAFLETPRLWREEEMQELIQKPANQILAHCIQNMNELSGEGLLLRLWTIAYLCRMFAPIVDLNELMYESLCTITESFFMQSHSDRFDALYGDIAWIHDGLKKDSRLNIDFALSFAKSTDLNGPVRQAVEPPVELRDQKHPWHLKTFANRTIVHDWYALCYWIMKLAPLQAPRGSVQATDQLHCIFAKWIEKHPELSGKTIVLAGAGLSLIANYLEPDKAPLQRSPRPLRRIATPNEPLSPFIKLCNELKNGPLDLSTWTKHSDSNLVRQMAMSQFSARTTILVLDALHTEKPDEERYAWLTKIDNLEANVLRQHIEQGHFDAPTLFEFFPWIMCPNQSFALRLGIAEGILKKLTSRDASIEEMRLFFNQLHVFFDEARREGYYNSDDTKAPLRALVDALFETKWYIRTSTNDLRALLYVIQAVEEGLFPPKSLENRFYEKCMKAFTNALEHASPSLKKEFLFESVKFYNQAALAETRDRIYPDIRQIAAVNEGFGIRFDETSAKLITHELHA